MVDWQTWWDRETPGPVDSNVLVDVNPQEALPHRDVSTERPHLPGASNITEHDSAAKTETALLMNLYRMRTRSELFFEADVELAVTGWQNFARTRDRLLYDCHECKITWLIREDANICPAAHPIGE